MGYYVNATDSVLRIKQENFDHAYRAMCELNWRNDLKRGGSYGPTRPTTLPDGPNEWIWFSWMPWNYHETLSTMEEILEALGFELDMYGGELCSVNYDSKTGSEEHFLRAIAPWVEDGSFIVWRGEDGAMWRWLFDNGEMREQTAKIRWRDS